MLEFIFVLFGAAFVNNFVLVKFLGLCPLLGTSRQISSAVGMSAATCLVIVTASVICYLVHQFILSPFGLNSLRLVVFITIIASTVQFIELFMRAFYSNMYTVLGIYLPLVTANCAVLGIALIQVDKASSIWNALATSIGVGVGFALVLIVFASLREKLDNREVPNPFRGIAIALITAGFMSLSFQGFSGIFI